jgi:hypothetical protein
MPALVTTLQYTIVSALKRFPVTSLGVIVDMLIKGMLFEGKSERESIDEMMEATATLMLQDEVSGRILMGRETVATDFPDEIRAKLTFVMNELIHYATKCDAPDAQESDEELEV